MDITQAQQIVQSNLANKKFVLDSLEVASESIPRFLTDLPPELRFTLENSAVSLEGDSGLRIKNSIPGCWDMGGVAVGMLQDTLVDLVLTAEETGLKPEISVSGSLLIPLLDRALPVTGALSSPGSWLVDFTVSTGQLPTFTQIASLTGIQGVGDQLAQLNITLPTVTDICFGFDINTKGFTYIGLDGRICFGSSELDVLCMFSPELIILGKIPSGGHILLADLLAPLKLDPASFPPLEISDLAFSLDPAAQAYSFSIALNGDWGVDISGTRVALTQISTSFDYAAQAVSATLAGQVAVGDTSLFVEARLEDGDWKFSGGLAEGSTVRLRSVINTFLPGSLELPAEVPDMGCKDIAVSFAPKAGEFSFKASSAEPWDIPVGVDGLSVSDISLDIQRAKKDDKSEVTGTIGGTLNIGTASFTAVYNFPGDFVLSGSIPKFRLSPLVQDLCGGEIVRSIPVPAGVIDLELQNIAFNIAPQKGEIAFSAGSAYGSTEIQIKRAEDKTWGFSFGFVPPEQWKLSAIDPALSALDGLKFSDTAFILASNEDKSFELATIKTPRADVAIKKGLNLFANLSMAELGVNQLLPGIDSLVIYAAIGSDPRNIVLEAEITGAFQIAENILFSQVEFRLQVVPPNFGVLLQGRLHALLDNCELVFIGGLGIEVTPPSFKARMVATMEGRWQDPFGVKGLAIADVALDLGIAFPPVRPSIGIAGALQIGDFTGKAAVKFDAANPRSSMVAIAFNRLYLSDIFNAFCPPTVKDMIPAGVTDTVLGAGFEDVDIYIVPQATTIGELAFEQGISLKGKMNLWGLRASAYLKVDQASGILVQGEVEPIDIAGVFKLTGAEGKPNASLYLDLRSGATPVIDISGAIELLGISSETTLQVSDKGFYLSTTGNLFNLFEASLKVRSGDFRNGDSIYIEAEMKNDLFAFLREKVTAAINALANDATSQLTAAQQQITNVQNTLNGWQGQIDWTKAQINQLNWEIAQKQNWYNNSQWWEKSYRWAELSAYCATRYAQIGALYAEIGGLEASKHVAFGVLEAAKWALEGVKAAVGAAADVAKFIATVGLGGLLDIRSARFEGYLNATSGGSVMLSLGLEFMGQHQDLTLAFDFGNPLNAVKSLVNMLVPA